MIEWFTEDALQPIIGGGFLAICLLGLAIYSGEKIMYIGALTVAALVVAIGVIEASIVTDREAAMAMIYSGARAANANDDPKIIALVHPDQTQAIERLTSQLAKTSFENLRIVGVKSFQNQADAEPQTASINFVILGSGTHRRYSGPFHLEVELKLQKVGDQWKVTDFSYSNPRSGTSL
jgi:hypothetical protein